ncbi:MAG: cell division protein SepF [Defluviitaleaceae bacterium]|nr:cell division protein SepF [Defluviitaleaceae bacterium]
MIGFFRKLGDKLSNNMIAPGAEETDGYYDDEYEYDDEPEAYEEPEPIRLRYDSSRPAQPSGGGRKSNVKPLRGYGAKDNVYGFTGAVNVQKQSETYIVHPKTMEDAVEIGSHVRSGRMCIVDLTGVATAEAQRIADYLCGNSDALDGSITRVNNSIIAVSPPSHRVMADFRDEPASFDSGFLKKAANDR